MIVWNMEWKAIISFLVNLIWASFFTLIIWSIHFNWNYVNPVYAYVLLSSTSNGYIWWVLIFHINGQKFTYFTSLDTKLKGVWDKIRLWCQLCLYSCLLRIFKWWVCMCSNFFPRRPLSALWLPTCNFGSLMSVAVDRNLIS